MAGVMTCLHLISSRILYSTFTFNPACGNALFWTRSPSKLCPSRSLKNFRWMKRSSCPASQSLVGLQIDSSVLGTNLPRQASGIRTLLRDRASNTSLKVIWIQTNSKDSSTDWMRLLLFQHGADGRVSNQRSGALILSKSEAICRYFTMPGRCVRREKYLFTHPAAGFMSPEMRQSFIPKQVEGTKPSTMWSNTFKEWLPEFQPRVSTRWKDGEWSRLASLERDHRAMCGLELDLASLGFGKLFVRSLPELCRMKIAIVYDTHLARPASMDQTTSSATSQRNMTTLSFVDGPSSQAEVACPEVSAARHGKSDTAPLSNAALCTSGTHLGHQGKHARASATSGGTTSSTDHQPVGLHQGLSSRGHRPSTAASLAGDKADLKGTWDEPPKTSLSNSDGQSRSKSNRGTSMTSTGRRLVNQDTLLQADDTGTLSKLIGETSSCDMNSETAGEDVAPMPELISRLKLTGNEHAPPANHAAAGFWPTPMTVLEAPPRQYSQKWSKNVDHERERPTHSPFIKKELKTPTRGDNPPPPLKHPLAGFLSENLAASGMWGQDAKRIKVSSSGIQGSGTDSYNSTCTLRQLYEDSHLRYRIEFWHA